MRASIGESVAAHPREASPSRPQPPGKPARGDLLGDGDGVARVEALDAPALRVAVHGSSRQRAWSSQVANVTMATLSPSGALKDLKSTNAGIADARPRWPRPEGRTRLGTGARREQKTVTTLFRAGSPLPATSHFRMRGRTSGGAVRHASGA